MPSEASLANLRSYQPGQTGNTIGAKGLRRALAKCRRNSDEALEVIFACMRDKDAPWPSRLTAACYVYDRAWGKAKEHVSFDGADGMNIMIVTGVPRSDDAQPVADETTYTIDYDAGEEDAS